MSIRFKEMVEVVRTYGLCNDKWWSTQDTKKYIADFFQLVEKNKIFVFSDSGIRSQKLDVKETLDQYSFSSPFDVISIEMVNPDNCLSASAPDEMTTGIMNTYCVMYDDVNDVAFVSSTFTRVDEIGLDAKKVVMRLSSKDHAQDSLYLWTKAMMEEYIRRINSDKVATEVTNHKVKIRSSEGGNKFHKINQVIYVSKSKSYFKNMESEGKKLDYSHRFFRRGHWRQYGPEHIGKDRHGERNQRGRSWVLEAVVGDENLPLVPKIRVVAAGQ